MPTYSLSELVALSADAERYEALKSLTEWVQQNNTDIASNGWSGSSNPNTFDSHRYVLTTGSSTAYVATFSPTFGSLDDGCMLKVDFHATSGASPTLNLDSLGAKDLIKPDGTAIESGDIPIGTVLPVIYSAALDDWVVIGIAPAAVNPWLSVMLFSGT